MASKLDAHFRKTNIASANEITFDPDMLKLLMAIDEKKTLRQIATEVALPPDAFKKSFVKLYNLKLIEEVEDLTQFVDERFIGKIKEALIELVGPLGEVLIEDATGELNTTITRIPVADAATLINSIARHIPGEKEQNTFRKTMLDYMKTLGS